MWRRLVVLNMVQSSWSEPESVVTMELCVASAGAVSTSAASSIGADFGRSTDFVQRRSAIPRVQTEIKRSDQQVPVYWDQTVPVLTCKEARESSRKKASLSSRGSDHVITPSIYSKSFAGNSASGEAYVDEVGDSSAVSFDAILSMYQSSLLEKSCKWSGEFGTMLKRRSRKWHDDRGRLWRNFARSFSGWRLGEVEEESLCNLHETIERENICDHSAIFNLHSGTLSFPQLGAIFQGRRWDFRHQLHNRRDSMTFNTPMLTTRSSLECANAILTAFGHPKFHVYVSGTFPDGNLYVV